MLTRLDNIDFEHIDSSANSWIPIFKTVNDNYEKVIFRLMYSGNRRVIEVFRLKLLSNLKFELHKQFHKSRNHLIIYVDGVRQFVNRDYIELNGYGFELTSNKDLQYQSYIVASYIVDEVVYPQTGLPNSIIQEYEEASRNYSDPRDRVRGELENIIDTMFQRRKESEESTELYISSANEVIETIDYLENFHYSNLPPGKYYVTPIVDSSGNIRWTKSQDLVRRPKARSFVNRSSIQENAIFIGTGEDTIPRQILDYGVIVGTEEQYPHYEHVLGLDYGGMGGDTRASGRVTDLFVLDNGRALSSGKLEYGVVNNSKEPDTEYNPGFVTGVLPIDFGGTGQTDKASLINTLSLSDNSKIQLDVLSTISYNKVMNNLSDYRKYIGKTFSIPTNSSLYGDLDFIVIGIGKDSGADRPKFTLMSKSVIANSKLSDNTSEPYLPYSDLDILHSTLSSIYNSIDESVRKQLKIAQNIPVDNLSKSEKVVYDTTLINPSDEVSSGSQHLWLLSLSEIESEPISDLAIPNSYYEYFSIGSTSKIIDIIGMNEGLWTRSQDRSNGAPRYFAYTRDGSVESFSVNTSLGIAPLICV